MYRSRNSNNSGRGRSNGNSSFRNNNNHNGFRNNFRQPRRIKQLNSSLFINRASNDIESDSHLSSMLYTDFPISDSLKRNISDHNYIHPTLIQEKTIPSILAGRDVIGIANTGTGKTAAFLIPLINKLQKDLNQRIIILAPTREIAIQIDQELMIFTKGMNVTSVLCIGGASMYRQEKDLRGNPQFVIGTPGRVKDLIQNKKLNLSIFQNVVLDEVDRMVDIGFIQDIKYFISLLPKNRQSLFFSATVSKEVHEILRDFVTDPVTVSVKTRETVESIDQDIVKIPQGAKKIEILHDLLIKEGFDKVLIFGRTKWGVEKLSRELVNRGFKAAAIHGNKTLGQRKRALEQFKQNQIQILLATDVASRGLDIDNVTHVINFDAPESEEDYTHRIGRTGRAGKRGIALTFVE